MGIDELRLGKPITVRMRMAIRSVCWNGGHSMKNELIIASYKGAPNKRATERLHDVLHTLGLEEMRERFFIPLA
jgi:hypothetical protein